MRAPKGKGVYLRDIRSSYAEHGGVVPYLRAIGATWAAALDNNATDAELVELKRAGFEVYIYRGDGPQWHPRNAVATLDAYAARARRLGLAGVIVDTEGGWTSSHREQATALAHRMVQHARSGLSVGWTSYPAWVLTDVIGAIAGKHVWGSPQIYGQPGAEPAKTQAWIQRWQASGWKTIVPSVAAWNPDGRFSDPAAYAAYLASFGAPRAVALWMAPAYAGGPVVSRGHMFDTLASWRVGAGAAISSAALLALAGAGLIAWRMAHV